MICPKCNKKNQDSAKFCIGCGTKLEAVWQAPVQPQQPKEKVCRSCGSKLSPGVKFCTCCGTKVEETKTAESQQEQPPAVQEQPSVVQEQPSAVQEQPSAVQEQPAAVQEQPAVQPKPQQLRQPQMQPQQTKKSGAPVAILIAVVALLLVAVLVSAVVFFLPQIKKNLPFPGEETTVEEAESPAEEQEEAEAEEETAAVAEAEIPEEELEALWEQREKAKAAYDEENYGGEEGTRTILEAVFAKCIELAETYGAENEDLCDTAEESFEVYVDAIFAQDEMLFYQDVRPELYEQIESDLNAGLEQAEKLSLAGLFVETDRLEAELAELKDNYADRYIAQFNTFTELETWSRTESWDLMSDADSIGLVDHDNMDDPMTQRYAYALARITIKNIENATSEGSMDAEDAVTEIVSALKDTDYNLFLMYHMAYYMQEADDAEGAENVYSWISDITERIYETQGIAVGEDIEIDYFWSFNEFEDDYSVSDVNGLTQSNHEWIREYMQDKL